MADEAIADLNSRLSRTRLPNEPAGNENWAWGRNLAYLTRLLAHWEKEFDWRKAEASLNRFPQCTAYIKGANGETPTIHFAFEKGSGPSPSPLS